MEAYQEFARVYDMFQDNIDYEAWGTYLCQTLAEYHIKDGLVLDLGCGTGTMTEYLSRAGYDMIGVDNSEDMLSEAIDKRSDSGLDILYLLQDMQSFELYGTVRAIISTCDSLNYLTEEEDLLSAFRLANNYLDPQGLFIFDMNTPYKYETLIGNATIAENRDDASFIWENTYDPGSAINEYALTLFIRREDGLYEKTEEYHYQKAYTPDQVKALLAQAGLEFLAVYDAYTKNPPAPDSSRLLYIARERGKKKPADA